MKKALIFFTAILLLSFAGHSQDDNNNPAKNIHWLFNLLKTSAPTVDFENLKNKVTKDPDLFNSLWDHYINTDIVKNKVLLLRDLDLRFKTFQNADTSVSALGFSYDWNLKFTKEYETFLKRGGFAFGLNAKGNIAFSKALNPHDFLNTDLNIGLYRFIGGVSHVNDTTVFNQRNELRQKLVNMTSTKEILNSDAFNEYLQTMKLGNQYMLELKITGGLESNQDFSKKQYAYGVQLNLGAKAWNDKNALALLNFFDYPFVITRWLTKTDESFSPYGATIPTVQFSIDYVKPQRDTDRELLAGDLNGYSRFHFETGFRTLLAEVKNQTFFFNAGFRLYKEFNAPAPVKSVKLDKFSYFSASITSNSGLFISYSYGNLPFDRSENGVYELGFKTNL